MSRPGAVESSQFRKEIEEMITEGKEDKYISGWLKENNAYISRQTIGTYRKERFNIPVEATKEYNDKQSLKRKQKAVEKTVSDLEFCDNIIQLANEVDLKVDPDKHIDELDITRLGLQAVKAKQEIFKQGSEDEKEFTIIIKGVDSDEDNNLEIEPETSK